MRPSSWDIEKLLGLEILLAIRKVRSASDRSGDVGLIYNYRKRLPPRWYGVIDWAMPPFLG